MQIDQTNIKELLRSLDRAAGVRITCNPRPYSVCALGILAEVLRRELVAHEVAFEPLAENVDLILSTEKQSHELRSDVSGLCSCGVREIVGPAIAYGAAKAMDHGSVATVWPLAVAFSFYREFVYAEVPRRGEEPAKENTANRGQDGGVRMCQWCQQLRGELVAQTKMLDCKLDGIFYRKTTCLPFLQSASLFDALRSDIRFVLSRQLLRGDSAVTRRIAVFLAGAGISLASAGENYGSLSGSARARIEQALGTRDAFVLASGHDVEIGALEHALLLHAHLSRGACLDALLSLGHRPLLDSAFATHFYQKAVLLFRGAARRVTRAGKVAVFQLPRSEMATFASISAEEGRSVLFSLLSQLCSIFLRHRTDPTAHFAIVAHASPGRLVIFTEGLLLSRAGAVAEILSPRLAVVEARDLNAVLKRIQP